MRNQYLDKFIDGAYSVMDLQCALREENTRDIGQEDSSFFGILALTKANESHIKHSNCIKKKNQSNFYSTT